MTDRREALCYMDDEGYMMEVFNNTTFTRSDGTLFARIYERLTRASRRKANRRAGGVFDARERAYRRGVKDTLEALRAELS